MAGITLAQAQAKLDALMALRPNELELRLNGRMIRYHSRTEVLQEIEFWDRKVKELDRTASGGRRVATPVARW